MDRHELYKAILRGATGIDLPQAPVFAAHEEQQAEEVLRAVERDIGEAAKGDYYTCCRLRFAMVIQLALRYLPPGASILDVGNAPGYLALALHKCGFKVAGINLSDAWLDAYPSKDVATLFNPKSCDIEREMTPYPDQSFDAIVFTEVLEHIAIKHPRKLVPEFKRVLKDQGVVLFSTPNVCNLADDNYLERSTTTIVSG